MAITYYPFRREEQAYNDGMIHYVYGVVQVDTSGPVATLIAECPGETSAFATQIADALNAP